MSLKTLGSEVKVFKKLKHIKFPRIQHLEHEEMGSFNVFYHDNGLQKYASTNIYPGHFVKN